ncbi:hypothetical protein QFC21_003881 [Naganishia friedmannii]|uniref:Uncharacterized protein n=1 Tax=Naganishia friedmannii TaxID=89922 RepID=A0ACC2VL92_9TREE|nr:hypothetical protein QFC21_003881 [Naganishia friedmannii]
MGQALTLDDFQFLTRIGKGQFGKVDAVRLVQDGQVYALKTIEKTKIARAGQSLDIELEKDILVRASVARESSNTEWMPTPRLLATFASPNCVHFVVSFANCGTLWDLFCSTGHTKPRSDAQEEWTEQIENATPFGGRSQVDSAAFNSLFHSMNGSSTLSTTLRRLPESTFMVYARQLVLALQWLHEEAGIVHRDVKPENVLLTDDGRAVMCDFGSAARLSGHRDGKYHFDDLQEARPSTARYGLAVPHGIVWAEPRYVPLSACQTLHGTADYIAPEVLQTYEQFLVDSDSFIDHLDGGIMDGTIKSGYDASVDWWSFGAMCYEMMSGLPPFYAKTVQETYGMIVSCQTIRIPHDSGFSVKISDFLTSLLLPSERRLGRLGPEQVKRHALFTHTDWDAVRDNEASNRPSGFENPKPLRLSATNSSEMASIYQDYSAGFDSSTLHMSPSGAMPTWAGDFATQTGVAGSFLEPCSDDQEASMAKSWLGLQALQVPASREDDDRWNDWNWVAKDIVPCLSPALVGEPDSPAKPVPSEAYPRLPILDRLKREWTPDRAQPSQVPRQPAADVIRDPVESPILPAIRFKTPARGFPGMSDAVQLEPAPLSVPRTMPRTVTRGTGRKMIIMSEKRAFKLMVKCVEASAKKKITASGRQNAHAKDVASRPNALGPSSRKSNIGETSSAYRKRSFLSKLQALNIDDSFHSREPSNTRDSVQTRARTVRKTSESMHGNASKAFLHGDGRESVEISSLHPTLGGFEAFIADLQGSANSSGFQSSPRPLLGGAGISFSSDTLDSSSTITDDEHPAFTVPAIITSNVKTIPTTAYCGAPVHPLGSSRQRAVAPKRMERDELLSRLFPDYPRNPTPLARPAIIDTPPPPGMNEMQAHRTGSRDSEEEVDGNEESEITPATLPLVDGRRYGTAKMESGKESSPTVVIKGLVGQHEQMKRSLAVR